MTIQLMDIERIKMNDLNEKLIKYINFYFKNILSQFNYKIENPFPGSINIIFGNTKLSIGWDYNRSYEVLFDFYHKNINPHHGIPLDFLCRYYNINEVYTFNENSHTREGKLMYELQNASNLISAHFMPFLEGVDDVYIKALQAFSDEMKNAHAKREQE